MEVLPNMFLTGSFEIHLKSVFLLLFRDLFPLYKLQEVSHSSVSPRHRWRIHQELLLVRLCRQISGIHKALIQCVEFFLFWVIDVGYFVLLKQNHKWTAKNHNFFFNTPLTLLSIQLVFLIKSVIANRQILCTLVYRTRWTHLYLITR